MVMDRQVDSFKRFIEIINTLDDEKAIQDFVYERLGVLESQSFKDNISFISEERMNGRIVSGYINSETSITSSFLVDPFYVNDATLYIEFIKFIKGRSFDNPLQLFHSLQDFSIEAFGYKGNQQIREAIYLNNTEGKISIGDFYKNNAAMCSERSAAIQNLVCFSGIDSYMVFCKLKDSNDNEEQHAYNILKMKDGRLILYDSTNPVTLLNGDCSSYVPAYHIFDKGINIEDLTEVKFDLQKLASYYQLSVHPDELGRTYYTPKYYLSDGENDLKLK
jgi:hypothetical protein